MAFGMIPLEVEGIDEGNFMIQLRERLGEAQQAIADHIKEFGDAAHKSTCKVDCSISLICMNPVEGTVAIKWSADVKRPKRPASVTIAMTSTDEGGKPTLYVKTGGSDSGDPRQTKFAKRDGTMVDPAPDGKSVASGERDSDYEDVAED